MKRLAYLFLLLGILCPALCSADPLRLDPDSASIALGPYLEYWVDADRSLLLDDLPQPPPFLPVGQDTANFGYTDARIWLRFQIDNPLPTAQRRLLDLRYTLLDKIHLYQMQPDGTVLHQRLGRLQADSALTVPGRFPSVVLDLPPHSLTRFYLSLESADSIAVPLFLTTEQAHQQYQIRDLLLLALYGGIILATLFFALFMLARLRERALVFYSLFLVAHDLLTIMMMEGIPRVLLGLNQVWLARDGIPVMLNFSILMCTLFMRDFLHLRERFTGLNRFAGLMAGVMAASLLLSALLPHRLAIQLTSLSCMLVGTGITLTSLISALDGQREARLFLLAWTSGIAGATVYGLKVWALLPVNLFTSYAWHAGVLLETILFSFTIADRVETERRQRLHAQTALVEQERALRLTQEKLLHNETAAKEMLEQQVRERTRDIARILSDLEHENRTLVELSINDGLTRVRNRRFFDDIFPQLWQEALEKHQPISLILLDIDHFKRVNDEHGHLMGDRCLVATAGALKSRVSRPTDFICRYGGEEFVIILVDTPPDSALWLAEALRKKVSETLIELNGSTLTVTASFGVNGVVPEPGLLPQKLIESCDMALYDAKKNGRNRVARGHSHWRPDNLVTVEHLR